jgi:hypothetical protein
VAAVLGVALAFLVLLMNRSVAELAVDARGAGGVLADETVQLGLGAAQEAKLVLPPEVAPGLPQLVVQRHPVDVRAAWAPGTA